jgi:AAA domain
MTTAPVTVTSTPGVNVLLEGAAGTGKTHSIGTGVDYNPDLHWHYFAFESGTESLIGYWTDKGKPVPSNLHINTVRPASAGWTEMAEQVKYINTLSYDVLKKQTDPNRSKYDQFEKFLRTFNDVREDNSDKKFGSVDSWDTNRVVVIDGLTGLGDAAMKAVIGGKADRDQKDWGLAQNLLENFLRKLTSDCRCHLVLLSHIDRETDLVSGGSKITVSTLGAKLAPKIPPMFSDVILCKRNVAQWFWDNADPAADLKFRNLPIGDKNPPNFKPIFDKWASRGGVIKAASCAQ